MNVLVLEGLNDVAFFKAFLNKHFSKNIFPSFVDKTNKKGFKKAINELRKLLLNNNYYKYVKANFGLIAYGNNGKINIIRKVLPRLVQDILGKVRDELKFFVVLDENGDTISNTVMNVEKEIKKKSIPFSEIRRISNDKLCVVSTKDAEYRIIIQLFLIPKSLEIQVRDKCLEKIGNQLSKTRRQQLVMKPPHKALEQLADIMNLGNKESLIKHSVNKNWFDDEEWYRELLNKFSSFCVLP